MDTFRLCLAIGPVAMYLLLLGGVNLSRRPLLVTGARDVATLALAVSGLVIIGPMELFFPFEAAARFGPYVWILLLTLYALGVVLTLLMLRPRLIIYNISADKLRPLLAETIDQLDPKARWAGDSIVLPGLGVQLYVDHFAVFRHISLVSAGGNQNHQGWRQLEKAMTNALAREDVARNPGGIGLLLAGLLLITTLILLIAQNPHVIAQSLLDMVQSLLQMAGL